MTHQQPRKRMNDPARPLSAISLGGRGLSVPQPLDLVALQRNGIPPIPWIVKPYLVTGELHLLLGDGQVGKSFLMQDTAVGLATGQPVLVGCGVDRPYRVLYFDDDGSRAQMVRRILAIAKARGIVFDPALADRLVIYSAR